MRAVVASAVYRSVPAGLTVGLARPSWASSLTSSRPPLTMRPLSYGFAKLFRTSTPGPDLLSGPPLLTTGLVTVRVVAALRTSIVPPLVSTVNGLEIAASGPP